MLDLTHDKYIRAGDPQTPIEELVQLAADEIDHIRRRIGENLRTPQAVLTALAGDANPEVRIAVGENAMTPLAVLHRLAEDPHADVRYSLAENPNLPVEILEKLSDDDNPYVSHRAQRTLRLLQPATLHELPQQKGEGIGVRRFRISR